jgi:hypothetical protein
LLPPFPSPRLAVRLRDADLVRPVDALLLCLAQLLHAEVRALALQSMVRDHLLRLLRVRQVCEFPVAERRAQLDPIDADLFQLLQQVGELAVLDHLPVRIRLAADRQPQGVRVKLRGAGREKAGDGGISCTLLEEFPS